MKQGQIYQGFVPKAFQIESYGNGGFRFGDYSHKGSLLASPQAMQSWSVDNVQDISIETLKPLLGLKGQFSFLLIGTGRDIVKLNPSLQISLKTMNIHFDVMQTGAAAQTWNIMIGESRSVAAALLAVT